MNDWLLTFLILIYYVFTMVISFNFFFFILWRRNVHYKRKSNIEIILYIFDIHFKLILLYWSSTSSSSSMFVCFFLFLFYFNENLVTEGAAIVNVFHAFDLFSFFFVTVVTFFFLFFRWNIVSTLNIFSNVLIMFVLLYICEVVKSTWRGITI